MATKKPPRNVCRLAVQINGTWYMAWRVQGHGWRLRKQSGPTYQVVLDPAGYVTCTCADANFRERQCKHCRSVAAMITAGLLGGWDDDITIPGV